MIAYGAKYTEYLVWHQKIIDAPGGGGAIF